MTWFQIEPESGGRVKWPWTTRAEQARREAEAAAREREALTAPLVARAKRAVAESRRHRQDNHFREAIEDLMRRQP